MVLEMSMSKSSFDEPRERCRELLESRGYRLTPLDADDDPSASDEWFAEP